MGLDAAVLAEGCWRETPLTLNVPHEVPFSFWEESRRPLLHPGSTNWACTLFLSFVLLPLCLVQAQGVVIADRPIYALCRGFIHPMSERCS